MTPLCPDCGDYADAHDVDCPHYVEREERCDVYERAEWRAEENWRDG